MYIIIICHRPGRPFFCTGFSECSMYRTHNKSTGRHAAAAAVVYYAAAAHTCTRRTRVNHDGRLPATPSK